MEIAVLDPYAEQKEGAIFKLLLGWKTSGKRVLEIRPGTWVFQPKVRVT